MIPALSEKIGTKNVVGIEDDLSNIGDLDKLYNSVKDQKEQLDILFANAGIIQYAPLGEISEQHFYNLIDINVKRLLFTVQKALPIFKDGGSTILNASIGASKAAEGLSVYCATNAAVCSFARTWTLD